METRPSTTSYEIGMLKHSGVFCKAVLLDRRAAFLVNLYLKGYQSYLTDIAKETNTTHSKCVDTCSKFRKMGLVEYQFGPKGDKRITLTRVGREISAKLHDMMKLFIALEQEIGKHPITILKPVKVEKIRG